MSGRKPYLPTLIAVAVLIACAAGLLAVPRGAEAAFPGENGRIAFSARERTEGSQYQIFTVEADGTGTRQLTETPASEYNTEPVFSPDGTKIAWVRSDGIWIMDADGTGEERFADGENPAWSPDGKRLAFVRRDRKEGDPEIYKKALGAERARRVTDNRVGFEAGPAWSPDGSRIAFGHSRGGDDGCLPCVGPSDIFSVRPDGTGKRRITDLPDAEGVDAYGPNWSPDGGRLVFGAYHYGRLEQGSIETVRADGTGRETVFAPGGFYALDPVFSPDGTRIAFFYEDGNDIWTMNPDGTGLTNVTKTPYITERTPDWGAEPPVGG